jgi:hypothetical protein
MSALYRYNIYRRDARNPMSINSPGAPYRDTCMLEEPLLGAGAAPEDDEVGAVDVGDAPPPVAAEVAGVPLDDPDTGVAGPVSQ